MSQTNREPDPKPKDEEAPPAAIPTHERPDVKPLVEKARAEPHARIPQGVMKTGADIAGGGGTKSLTPDEREKTAESE